MFVDSQVGSFSWQRLAFLFTSVWRRHLVYVVNIGNINIGNININIYIYTQYYISIIGAVHHSSHAFLQAQRATFNTALNVRSAVYNGVPLYRWMMTGGTPT
jgi:hypothetical protein